MKKILTYIIVLHICFACTQTKKTKRPQLLVFCAASLTNVISELSEKYKSVNNIDIQLNFASSGTLARQIEHGAGPSVYISANEKWVDYLGELGMLVPETRKRIAGNSLVAIVPVDSSVDSVIFNSGFAKTFKRRLVMGDPKHVPAGEYAQQAIENGGCANALKERILPTKDVRSALMVVELGECEMGIVYRTDAMKSEKVRIVSEISTELHSPIALYGAVLKNGNNNKTMHFYAYLSSEEAKTIWIKHGFKIE